jgi:hypothetical protein
MYRYALPEEASSHMESRSLTAKQPDAANDAYGPHQISPQSLILPFFDCWNRSRATHPCRNTKMRLSTRIDTSGCLGLDLPDILGLPARTFR